MRVKTPPTRQNHSVLLPRELSSSRGSERAMVTSRSEVKVHSCPPLTSCLHPILRVTVSCSASGGLLNMMEYLERPCDSRFKDDQISHIDDRFNHHRQTFVFSDKNKSVVCLCKLMLECFEWLLVSCWVVARELQNFKISE